MKTMETNTYIRGGINYARLLDVMNMLMCWNWDFQMDTCNGVLKIIGYSVDEFLEGVEEERQYTPGWMSDLKFRRTPAERVLLLETI